MYVYAGIDEAGYGPLFGPLLVSRAVIGIQSHPHDPEAPDPPCLWRLLDKAVCRRLTGRKGRIAVNDSKKLHTPASGIKHLESAALSFAALGGHRPKSVDRWLDTLGETDHHQLGELPWYRPTPDRPWATLPCANTPGELAVAQSLLATAAKASGVQVLDLGVSTVFEDRFNQMVLATRSKAATSFTFVTAHLRTIWDHFGDHHPIVIVDRQSGRVHYRDALLLAFPDAQLAVLEENPNRSAYRLWRHPAPQPWGMTIRFEVQADGHHLPASLASMISKYSRELLMDRFKSWFAHQAPQIKPTAGYGSDAKRFWQQVQPLLPKLSIQPQQLRRVR